MSSYDQAIKSVQSLPDQALDAWKQALSLKFPEDYSSIQNVVFCGMGGSSLPAHMLVSVTDLKVPFEIVNDYHLPWYVDENTLVVLASYSGNTEEVLSCLTEAVTRDCKVIGLTSGGQLAREFEENKYPLLKYDTKFNPSGQPRMGTCYGLFGLLGILYQLDLVESIDGKLSNFVVDAIKNMKGFVGAAEKAAKEVAPMLRGRLPVIFAGEHLVGNAHVLSNQLNETAKTFATWFPLPEANHHLLEGLKHPNLPLTGVFLKSNKYGMSMTDRLVLTKQIMDEAGHQTIIYEIKSFKPLAEVLSMLVFSGFLSVELSKLNEEDPLAIPTIDYFKEQLEKN